MARQDGTGQDREDSDEELLLLLLLRWCRREQKITVGAGLVRRDSGKATQSQCQAVGVIGAFLRPGIQTHRPYGDLCTCLLRPIRGTIGTKVSSVRHSLTDGETKRDKGTNV